MVCGQQTIKNSCAVGVAQSLSQRSLDLNRRIRKCKERQNKKRDWFFKPSLQRNRMHCFVTPVNRQANATNTPAMAGVNSRSVYAIPHKNSKEQEKADVYKFEPPNTSMEINSTADDPRKAMEIFFE
jgi:hypothetical protein